MKPSRKLLGSVLFLTVGPSLVHAQGNVQIGGIETNITAGSPYSPLLPGADAVVSNLTLTGALAGGPAIVSTGTGDITVKDAVSWTNANALKLDGQSMITVSAALTNTGGGALEIVSRGDGIAFNGTVEMSGSGGTLATRSPARITQSAGHVLTVSGLASFDTGSSSIVLTENNSFGSLSLKGGSVTMREKDSTNFASVDAGSLDFTSAGVVGQSGVVKVAGLAKIDAGTNDIVLANGGNSFGSLSLKGGAITIAEADATSLASVAATGLTVTSAGAIANSGDVAVSGLASFDGASIALGSGAGTVSAGSLHFNSTGEVSARLVAGTTLTGANTAGNFLWNTDGTATIAVGGKVTASSANIRKGAIALTGNNQLAADALTVETGASLELGAFNNTVTTYNQTDGATLAGSGTLSAATYNLAGGAVNANLGAGSLNQTGNATNLNGVSAASAVKVSGGVLALGAAQRLSISAALTVETGALDLGAFDQRVGSYTQKTGGSLNGTGTLTAASYNLGGGAVNANLGDGALNQTAGLTTLNGTVRAGGVKTVSGGTLRLGAAERLADSSELRLTGGAFDLGAFNETVGIFTTSGGSLNGTGTLTAGESYKLGGGVVNANLGAGQLDQTGGSSTLNGTSAATTVNIMGGSLALGSAERLADSAALRVIGGTLNLATGAETVGTFSIHSGALAGAGTLTATTYQLNGGAIDANLGAGSMTVSAGATVLNGTSQSALVEITGGTLTLGGENRLAGDGSVRIAGGRLDVGNFRQTVGAFSLNGGTLGGSGTLVTAVYDLRGGQIDANLGAGILSQAAGVTTLNGSSAAASVRVDAGALKLGASGRMDDAAQVIVASAATLDLGSTNDTVGSFELNSATLDGSGTLTAGRYLLRGGIVNGNLGSGALGQLESTTTLNGISAAETVDIQGGNLVLGASGRLADSAAVTIRSATVLDLGNFTETVGSVTLRSGVLAGTGTLTAATYDLGGGAVNANLGGGALSQTGGLTILNGSSAASTVTIRGGFLQLGAANRLADGATLNLGPGSLEMGNFSETIRTLNLGAGQLNGLGTLTAATYNLRGGAVNANLGGGALNQLAGVTTLRGISAASSVGISGGALSLGSANRLADGAAVQLSGGELRMNGFADTVATYRQTGGILTGAGGLRVTGGIKLGGGEVAGKLSGKTKISGPVTVSGTLGGGAIKVKGGALTLAGTAGSSVTVNRKGTLRGAGLIDGNLKSKGTIAVDSKGGDLTITGSLVTKGKVKLNLKNARNFESIDAGSVKFGGKLIIKNTGGGLKYGQQVVLFDADAYSQSFKKVKAVGFGQYVVFDADTGILTSLGDKEPRGKSVATAAKAAPAAPTESSLAPPLAGVFPLVPANPSMNAYSPEVHRSMSDYSEESIGRHVRQATEAAPIATAGGLRFFATTHASTSGVDGSFTNAGYDLDSHGVTAGVSGDVSKSAAAGGFLGFDDGSIKGSLIDTDARGFLLGAFGSLLLDTSARTKLTASAAYGAYQFDATRHSAGGDVRADDVDSHVFDFSLGIETLVFEENGFRVTPGAALRHTTGKVDGFVEQGPGFPLGVDSQDIDSTELDLAVNFDYEVNKHFSLAGSLGYTFALGDSDERIFARYAPAGSPKFSVNSPGIDNEAFVLGLGANYDIDANTRIGVNYLGEFRTSSEDAHSIGIGISRSF